MTIDTSLVHNTATTNHQFATAQIMNLPNVLHFLQSEWRKFESERDAWIIERAEFQSKLMALEGERRGLENVKVDLLQRIKLLELGLKQERLKCLRPSGSSSLSTDNSSSKFTTLSTLANEDIDQSHDSMSISCYPPIPHINRENRLSISQRTRQNSLRSRDILKAYLNEVSSLCFTTSQNQDDGKESNVDASLGDYPASGSQNSNDQPILPISFYSNHQHSTDKVPLNASIERTEPLITNFQATNVKMRRESKSIQNQGTTHKDHSQPMSTNRRVKHTLRHHMDSVRMVDVHSQKNILASASMDHTIKLWQIGQKRRDIEPYLTLRAHHAPVLSVAFDTNNSFLFSGSADASLCAWKLPKECTVYSPSDRKLLLANLKGHTDAIWDLKVHAFHSILASCSSDGTVRLWDTQLSNAAISRHIIQTNGMPTSVSFVPSDLNKLLVSLANGKVLTFDIETAKIVNSFTIKKSITINRVVVHPTMTLTTTVCDDGSVQFVDWSTGATIHHFESAHSTATTSVDMCPGGLSVATGGHDCVLRVWDIGMRSCVHESSEHTSRRNEGIWSVCYGGGGVLEQSTDENTPTSAALVSAGSDGIVKVYHG